MIRHYCTLFDKNYLANFLVLTDSIKGFQPNYRIYAFCMDEISYDYLQNEVSASHIMPISQKELISFFPKLSKIKASRSIVEFYFTCSSYICSYVLAKEQFCSHVTYLDADLYFFNSPEFIYQEIGDASIAIIPHRFYGYGKRFEKYGIYNVGWVTFKNNEIGRECLQSWLLKCTDWCFDYYDKEKQRFGDQKYLDDWVDEFKDVKIIRQKGANLAPWNIGQYRIYPSKDGMIYVDEDLLVFYHFASFRKLDSTKFTTNISRYFTSPSNFIKTAIYSMYLQKVYNSNKSIHQKTSGEKSQTLSKDREQIFATSFAKLAIGGLNKLRRWLYNDYIYLNE